jgi:hypothetical protein
MSPQATPTPMGSPTSANVQGVPVRKSTKTRKARSLRRESKAQSSYFALMFLMSAALFLVGVIIVLIISLLI